MKKINFLLLVLLFSLSVQAQSKVDVIQKINGEEMKGKITAISDTDVTFVYSGETLVYTIKKADIQKIIHSSGRVEMINTVSPSAQERQKTPVTMTATSVDHHNKIAVLPFSYLIDNQPGAEEIGFKAQEDTYSFLVQHSAGYTILDPRTTNALLIKAGITRDKIMGYTMKDICDVLGVEYIIDGTVTQAKGYQTNYSGGTSDTKVKRNDNDKVKGVSTYDSSYSNSAQRYDVSVTLHIYMDNNASIYNQSHKALFTNTDGAYNSPLEYLLKRCPLYRK